MSLKKGLTVCHFSDWRGRWSHLPDADIYICTGNMLPSFTFRQKRSTAGAHFITTKTLAIREAYLQGKYVRQFNVRPILANRNAPLIVCRGGRDFVSLAKLFEGGPVFEVGSGQAGVPEVWDVAGGARVAGLRGVAYAPAFETLSDCVGEVEYGRRIQGLPLMIDILVTAVPPSGILDRPDGEYPSRSVGSIKLARYLENQFKSEQGQVRWPCLKLHCFGGTKGRFGVEVLEGGDTAEIVASNASGGYRLMEWNGRCFTLRMLQKDPPAIKPRAILRSRSTTQGAI